MTISLLALTLLALPFALVALMVSLDSRGPALYLQERVGQHGRPFTVYKFRTMVVGAEGRGMGIKTSPDDPRITRAGRLLRATGIDELPQLLNVLKGDMSIVGPRPTVQAQVQTYGEYERQRLLMKPGVTGLAIVRGRNALSWPERIECDVEYMQRFSIGLDFWIMIQTVLTVIVTRKGVYRQEGETRHDHEGSDSED